MHNAVQWSGDSARDLFAGQHTFKVNAADVAGKQARCQ